MGLRVLLFPKFWTWLCHLMGPGSTPYWSIKTSQATKHWRQNPKTNGESNIQQPRALKETHTLIWRRLSCLFWSLLSSAIIQKVFYRICSTCSLIFDVYVLGKLISPSYSSVKWKVLSTFDVLIVKCLNMDLYGILCASYTWMLNWPKRSFSLFIRPF